eukprot:gene9501-1742_t
MRAAGRSVGRKQGSKEARKQGSRSVGSKEARKQGSRSCPLRSDATGVAAVVEWYSPKSPATRRRRFDALTCQDSNLLGSVVYPR